VQFYASAWKEEDVMEKFKKPIPKATKSAAEAKESCSGGDILKNTIDHRKCVSPCTNSPYP